jgi:hypothetical protein
MFNEKSLSGFRKESFTERPICIFAIKSHKNAALGRGGSVHDEVCLRSEYYPIFKANYGSIASPRAGPKYTDYVVLVLKLNYCLKSEETRNMEAFVDTLQKGLSSDVGEKVMTIAEQLIQHGIERGIEQEIVKREAAGIDS